MRKRSEESISSSSSSSSGALASATRLPSSARARLGTWRSQNGPTPCTSPPEPSPPAPRETPAKKRPQAVPPTAAQGHRGPERAHSRCHCAAQHAPAARDLAGLPAASPVKEPSVVVTLRAGPAPPPLWPWPSPGAVRCGADSRPGPLRPPTARDASASGGVALSGGGHCLCRRLHRHVQPWADR